MVNHSSGAAAKSYYGSGLSREDYYSQGQEIIGKWHGKGATKLKLSGDVSKKAFERLCDNLHPETGERLTPRNDKNRIVGFDINFHAPKSLSVVQAMTGDQRLVEAFRLSVAETMGDIEDQTATRVRANGHYEDRQTGNLTWAEFVHFTARPVEGIPDPHLHVHAFAFNATFDDVEQRWKAAKIREARQDMPLHQAAFHARLAQRVSDLGYAVERTRSGWEISGMKPEIIQEFSRRTALIEEEASKRGITRAEDKDGLGALTREGKRQGFSKDRLREIWAGRISAAQEEEILNLHGRFETGSVSAKEAVDHAIAKQFSRDAVVRVNRLMAEAMRFGVGNVAPAEAERELSTRGLILKKSGTETLCTTRDVLAEEVALIATVRDGKNGFSRLGGKKHRFKREYLSDEQKNAVRQILNSQDRVIAMRGGAGTGKTTTMQEVVEAIQINGRTVHAFAPSASASRETLREAGFENAETVAHYLRNEKLQKQVRGQVLWIDEAGLLGTREMWQVFEAAGPDTRIFLTGDTKQHGPVSRGDPFRVMQEFGGLRPIELSEIRRQKPQDYKGAVQAIEKNDLSAAFEKLERIGAIVEIPKAKDRYRKLAEDYQKLTDKKHRPLVVSPTHKEGKLVTDAIREKLKESGQLSGKSREFMRYRNLQWTESGRKEMENYSPGLMIQFHQNAKGIQRGERFWVKSIRNGQVLTKGQGDEEKILPLDQADRFQVFASEPIHLQKGDQIRVTRNGKSLNGVRHSNGHLREVAGFLKEGHIKLTTGAIIARDNGHFAYGYCETSHSAQSRSVRDVFIAQSVDSFAASNREQFYVSVSRGQERVRIYTDDKAQLRQVVGASSARKSALELTGLTSTQIDKFMQRELNRTGWRKALEQRRGKAEAGKQVEKLLEKRRQSGQHKAKDMSWARYVEKRRGLGEPAQRERGKGSPNLGKKRTGPTKSGHTLLKTRGARETFPADKKAPLTPQHQKPEVKPKPVAQPESRRSKMVSTLFGNSKYRSKMVGGHKIRVRKAGTLKPDKSPTIGQKLKAEVSRRGKAFKEGLYKRFDSGLIRKLRGSDQYRIKTINGHKMRVRKAEKQKAAQPQKQPNKRKVPPKPAPRRGK